MDFNKQNCVYFFSRLWKVLVNYCYTSVPTLEGVGGVAEGVCVSVGGWSWGVCECWGMEWRCVWVLGDGVGVCGGVRFWC